MFRMTIVFFISYAQQQQQQMARGSCLMSLAHSLTRAEHRFRSVGVSVEFKAKVADSIN